MKESDCDELAFFAALADCGARVLLIGRRALVVLGFPVLTADHVRQAYRRWRRDA